MGSGSRRLSCFWKNWNAPLDALLLILVERGELTKPHVLAGQTKRRLDDPRNRGFTRPFAQQWLELARLDFFELNRECLPRFDART